MTSIASEPSALLLGLDEPWGARCELHRASCTMHSTLQRAGLGLRKYLAGAQLNEVGE